MIVRTRLLATAIAAILVLAACGKEDEQANAAAAQINAATKGGPAAAAGNAKAEQLLAQAQQFANTGRDAQAHDAFERAVAMYRDAGDIAGQGRALLGLATHTRVTGQGEVARDIYARAKAAFAQAGDALGQAQVGFAVAELERARFNNAEALRGFQQAADAFHSQGQWAMEGQALLGVVDSERRLGKIVTADATVARARAIFDILNDRAGQQAAERTRQELITYLDENDEARAKFALDIGYADQGGSRRLEAQGNLGMGRLEVSAGHPVQARRFLNEARAIFAEMKLPAGEMDAWAALGDLERRLGDADAARVAHGRAILLFDGARNDPSTDAQAYAEAATGKIEERQAVILAGMAMLDPPVEAPQRIAAARAMVAPGVPMVDGAILLAQADLERRKGEGRAAASSAFALAERTFANASIPLGVGQALLAYADFEQSVDPAAASRLYTRALQAFLEARDRIGEALARAALAQTLTTDPAGTMEANVQFRIAARMFDELGLGERSTSLLNAARALR